MGAGASKAADKAGRQAAQGIRRQYPTKPSIPTATTSSSSPPSSSSNPAPTPTPNSDQTAENYEEKLQQTNPSAQVYPDPNTAPPSSTRSNHIDLDGRDPQFAASLSRLGPAVEVNRDPNTPAQKFPTSSKPPAAQQAKPSQPIFPTNPTPGSRETNPSMLIVTARDRIAQRFESESENLGRATFTGRTLINAKELSEVIRLRDERGMSASQVEKQMKLKPGTMGLLGPKGCVENA